MSRIHEALKKAEQDRATPHAAEVPPPPQATQASPAPAWEETLAAAPAVPAPPAIPIVAEAAAAPTSEDVGYEELRIQCAHPRWHVDRDTIVFGDSAFSAQAAEQFRTLRSRLYQIRANHPLRTILITSPMPQEGKTWVTSNLAQAIVRQTDRRALIIDADLRASRLHVPLGAPLSPGLTDYLKGEADEMKVIQHGADGNLCLIAGGNPVPNPSELLSSGRMKTLLNRVAPLFDWILVDSPPCLSVADAGILAALCDGILVVVRAGKTPVSAAEKAQHELSSRNVIGVVLNAVEETPAYATAYHYGYGYGNGNGKGLGMMHNSPK